MRRELPHTKVHTRTKPTEIHHPAPPPPNPLVRLWRFLLGLVRRLSRYTAQIVIVLVALLVGLRVALPTIVKYYVNKTLDQIDGYHGHVNDVDIHLWRGAYSIKEVTIVKTDGKVPVPFFDARWIDFSVEWAALFEGALVAKIEFDRPNINFVAGPTKAETQVGVDKPWLSVIKELFPLDINRFEVKEGSVHYRDFYSQPKVDLKLSRIHMLATNLTNTRKYSKTLVANIGVTGIAFEASPFHVDVKLDPSTEKATFEVAAKVEPVPLAQLNDFVEAYGYFHFQKGTLELAIELAAKDGTLTGYIKPLLDDIAIIDLRDAKNPVKFLWEGAVAGITRPFRNQPHDRLATKIPISGDMKNPKIGILPTLGNILKNEFIRHFNGDLDHTISLLDAEKAKENPKGPPPPGATK